MFGISKLAFTPDGRPAISSHDATNLDVKYTEFNGTTWDEEIVTSSGDAGKYTSLVLDISNEPEWICRSAL